MMITTATIKDKVMFLSLLWSTDENSVKNLDFSAKSLFHTLFKFNLTSSVNSNNFKRVFKVAYLIIYNLIKIYIIS